MPEATRAKVDELALLSKRSRSYIINAAVEAYVKDRAAYLRELDAAVLSAESGVGHSGESIFTWMRSWGSDNEIASPKPDMAPTK